jgi:formate dehydrogenase subunit gamma
MSQKPPTPAVDTALAIAAQHGNRPDALLEMLHEIQHRLGFVPDAVIPPLAQALNRSRAEVFGVISFYHDFRRQPAGRHVVKVCRAEACQARGARATEARLEQSLKIRTGETAPDGSVTLEAVYCLGLCAIGPNLMVDGRLHARAEGKRLETLLAEITS